MSIWRRLAAIFALVLFGIVLSACDDRKNTSQTASSSTTNVVTVASSDVFTVLAGSELKDVAPALEMAAQSAGVKLVLSYAGTLDMVERVNAGEQFDAVLPPNGAYPALALNTKPLARDKLFYSRVALGVKTPVLRKLGWDKKAPTWTEIAKAAASGRVQASA